MATLVKTNKKKWKEPKELRTKVYEPRPSLLTDLFDKNVLFKSLYNLCFTLVLFTVISTAITNYQRENRFYLGSKIIKVAFQNFDVAVLSWMYLIVSTNVVYGGFIVWSSLRNALEAKQWDWFWLTLYIIYCMFLLLYPCMLVTTGNLGIASSIAILTETTRILMKTYAFVRSNTPKYLQQNKNVLNPTYSHYMYFLFVPTLVYKDTYPRTNEPIKWWSIIKWFLEFGIGLLFFGILFENYFLIPLKDFGTNTCSVTYLFLIQIQSLHIGTIMYLLLFYCGFQCYLNAMGEMLKFSDRLFYKKWWMSNSIEEMFRSWNIVVHDWLYVYVYKDIYENILPGNKTISRAMVLLLSGIFHDFIFGVASHIYVPYYLFLYILIAVAIQLRITTAYGMCLWAAQGFGVSAMITFYTAEYYVRINRPIENGTFVDSFRIRVLYC